MLLKSIGLLFILAIGIYIFLYWRQGVEVTNLCNKELIGQKNPNIDELKHNSWLSAMKINIDENGLSHQVMCSSTTMCDNFCEIVFKDDIIVELKQAPVDYLQ